MIMITAPRVSGSAGAAGDRWTEPPPRARRDPRRFPKATTRPPLPGRIASRRAAAQVWTEAPLPRHAAPPGAWIDLTDGVPISVQTSARRAVSVNVIHADVRGAESGSVQFALQRSASGRRTPPVDIGCHSSWSRVSPRRNARLERVMTVSGWSGPSTRRRSTSSSSNAAVATAESPTSPRQ